MSTYESYEHCCLMLPAFSSMFIAGSSKTRAQNAGPEIVINWRPVVKSKPLIPTQAFFKQKLHANQGAPTACRFTLLFRQLGIAFELPSGESS